MSHLLGNRITTSQGDEFNQMRAEGREGEVSRRRVDCGP